MKSNAYSFGRTLVLLSVMAFFALWLSVPHAPAHAEDPGASSGGQGFGGPEPAPGSIPVSGNNTGQPAPAPAPSNTGQPAPAPAGTGGNAAGYARLTNPLAAQSIAQFVQMLLRAVVAIGVPIAILFIVLAGFKFITAQGNSEKLSEARRNFVHVVIGIAIFLGAWTLAQIIAATLRQIGA